MFLKKFCEDTILNKWSLISQKRKKKPRSLTISLLRAKYGNDMHYFCKISIAKKSITWTNLAAREAGKCSLSIFPKMTLQFYEARFLSCRWSWGNKFSKGGNEVGEGINIKMSIFMTGRIQFVILINFIQKQFFNVLYWCDVSEDIWRYIFPM